MIKEPTREMLCEAVTLTLEEAAFVIVEPTDQRLDPSETDLLLAQITVQMRSTGVISAVAPTAFGALLASNLMGLSPDSPEALRAAGDAFGEFLNMTSGALADAWLGQAVPYELSTPEIRPASAESLAALRDAAHTNASLLADDEYVVEIGVRL